RFHPARRYRASPAFSKTKDFMKHFAFSSRALQASVVALALGALVRVEQLYPFPRLELACVLGTFGNLEEVVWAQEEDVNQGAWRFVRDELEAVLPSGCRLTAICRAASARGAHSSVDAHRQTRGR
ncbi:hypothetical protein, partial [Burkholderia anthina]|uniref:hypothetical protein n=1 Tax=Burkholderia anthina TaxID=179879 RepID=UPI001FC8B974